MCEVSYGLPSAFYNIIIGIQGDSMSGVINFFIGKNRITFNTLVPNSDNL